MRAVTERNRFALDLFTPYPWFKLTACEFAPPESLRSVTSVACAQMTMVPFLASIL
jgi:hypothetical protein